VLKDLRIGNSKPPDNKPPDCSKAVASPSKIWPPNGEFRSILVNGVTDPDGDDVTIKVKSIHQDEQLNTQGDGDTWCPDAKLTATGGAEVRAERSDSKDNGRVYHIKFVAKDGKGGKCKGEVKVCVPYKKKSTCVDGGALFKSTNARQCT
jgi:hypothetical protein